MDQTREKIMRAATPLFAERGLDGVTEFFRGCPPEWKRVSFENLALSDGRRVSGIREDGKITITECK